MEDDKVNAPHRKDTPSLSETSFFLHSSYSLLEDGGDFGRRGFDIGKGSSLFGSSQESCGRGGAALQFERYLAMPLLQAETGNHVYSENLCSFSSQ